MRRFNIFESDFGYDEDDPPGFRAGSARFGPQIGARRLGGTVYELPPGQSVCPYHYEVGDEEFLIVLHGRPSVRHPGGEEELAVGDAVCFPEGPDGAHRVSNHTTEPARVLMLSTMREPAVTVYPDSNKVGAYSAGDEPLRLLFRRSAAVDYYDGEPDAADSPTDQ
jgi:uncharacterized cupin superfamily protein